MNYNRIVVTESVYRCDGRLKVEKGAVGTIRSEDQGYVCVVFDEGQSLFIEKDFGGRPCQEIPFHVTRPLAYAK